ncbi:MAG: DUF1292 domain-containing protein [Eubacteriaceae bacterium]|jgi:uncharacterized protein YrzB (UPF0473 family)
MDESNRFLLKNENGEEQEFELVVSLDIDDKTYILLADEGDDSVYPFVIRTDEDGEEMLYPVEDEDEFKLIEEAYDALSDEDASCCCSGEDSEDNGGCGCGCGCSDQKQSI